MVAPEREPLRREVEIDEFFLGGLEEGRRGGRQHGEKALCGIAIEVRGAGSGRLRLAVLEDASGPSLGGFAKATTAKGAIVHTDGWKGYNCLAALGYDHRRRPKGSVAPGEQLLPRAHRAISNLKAWMHGTHRGVSEEHLPRLPRRVRLPPQPSRDPHGRLPDPARARSGVPADDLPPDHPPGRLRLRRNQPDMH